MASSVLKMKDPVSRERVMQTHPLVRERFAAFICEAEGTLNMVIRIMLPVFRTVEEQNKLFAQGRNANGIVVDPSKVVTNARGGQSLHNFGLAIDCCEVDAYDKDGDGDAKEINWKCDMAKVAAIAEKHGIEWGGNWKTIKDYPHFQITFGYTWKQLLALKKDPQGYPITYERSTII